MGVSFETAHTQDVQAVFGESSCLVEAAYVDFACDVDPARGYAENAEFAESADGKACSNG